MINTETVKFIAMLNELAWRTQTNHFVPVRDKKVDDETRLCNAICTKIFYDVNIAQQIDESYVYFKAIKHFGKDGYEYYHTYVGVPKDSKENDRCLIAFADEDWNEDKEFIIYHGHWMACGDA